MDESEQPFAVNEYEPQCFPGMESELPLDGNDIAEQPIFEDNEYGQQSFPIDENQNFNGAGHESEHFDGHESKQGEEEVVQEQSFVEHESDQLDENDQLAENEAVENDSKQESPGNDHNETEEFAEDLHPEGEQAQTNAAAADTEDKKWPGWPGENVFRMLVPAQKVGNIIGRKGEYIKKMVEETRARIKILDGPPGTVERAVMVSAKEEPDASLPPAIDGLLRVHKRIVEGLEGDSAQAAAAPGAKVSTKLLVPATQAGSLIGKQGATVKTIQEASGCIVRVLGSEDLPIFALQDDRVVEVVGEPAAVHKAIELIGSQLRKFLVDRTVIPLFEMQMQHPNTHMEHMPPPHQGSWGPPHGMPPNAGGGPGPGYGPGHHYMPPPRQHDNYFPPPEMPPPQERQPHHGISAYGREPAMGGQAPANTQSAPTMITQVTQHMQIPLSYADAVIGASGSSISYIRRASGATVTIQESRGVPGEMTVEISGTASQVQAAQQLIQNCMAGAGAPAPAQTAPSTEQGYSQNYSSYAAAPPTYASPASNTGYASQQGAYGSVYGNSYGY